MVSTSTAILIFFISSYVYYFSLIYICHNELQGIRETSTNDTFMNCQQICVDRYLKKPFDNIMYLVDLISSNINKLLLTFGLSMVIYGWLTNPDAMSDAMINIYLEIKNTVTALITKIWTTAHIAISTVWMTISVIKMLQFVFLLMLLLSVPEAIEYMKKVLIRYAKLN